jgi:hypothetical protein
LYSGRNTFPGFATLSEIDGYAGRNDGGEESGWTSEETDNANGGDRVQRSGGLRSGGLRSGKHGGGGNGR